MLAEMFGARWPGGDRHRRPRPARARVRADAGRGRRQRRRDRHRRRRRRVRAADRRRPAHRGRSSPISSKKADTDRAIGAITTRARRRRRSSSTTPGMGSSPAAAGSRERPLRGLSRSGVGHDDRLAPEDDVLRVAGVHPRTSARRGAARRAASSTSRRPTASCRPISRSTNTSARGGADVLQAGRLQRGEVRRAELHALARRVRRAARHSRQHARARRRARRRPRAGVRRTNTRSGRRSAAWRTNRTTTAPCCFSRRRPPLT